MVIPTRGKFAAVALVIVAAAAVGAYFLLVTSPPPTRPLAVTELRLAWESAPLVDRDWLIENGLYAKAYSWQDSLKGTVVASPDERYVAVTTQKGEIFIFTADGREAKRLSYGVGAVPYCVEFSPDGRYMVVGLSSKKGEMLVYDTADWSVVWTYDASRDLPGESNATEATIVKSPSDGNIVRFVTFDGEGRMYVVASSREIDPEKQGPVYKRVTVDLMKIYPELREKYPDLESYDVSMWGGIYFSRILAIKVGTWEVLWKWPAEDAARILVPMVDVDRGGRYLVLCTWWGYDPADPYAWHGGTVVTLDAGSAGELWRWDICPRVPIFNQTNIWNGIGITDDGKYVLVEPSDGRVFLVDNERSVELGEPVVVWQTTIMTPVEAEVLLIPEKAGNYTTVRSYIYAGTYFAGIVGDKVVPYASATYATYWSPLYERRPLIQHPNQTKLFVLDLKTGQLLYIDKFFGKPMYGKVVPFAKKGDLLIGCVGNDWVAADAAMAGVYIWDLSKLERVGRFLTIVPTKYGVPLDVAVAGNYVFVLVGPINLATDPTAPANIVGEYKLLALKLGA